MVKSTLRSTANGTASASGKKSPLKKLRVGSPYVAIKWTNGMVNSLLTLVLEMAPYRQSENKNIGSLWEEIATRFLSADACSDLRNTFSNIEDGKELAIRRMKEKFWKVTRDMQAILGAGESGRVQNNSGLVSSPEMDEMKKLCEAIERDKNIDEDDFESY